MPAPPKIGNTFSCIGVVKIFRKSKAKHFAQANGHIGIAAKIKINLQGIRHDAKPGITTESPSGGNCSTCCHNKPILLAKSNFFPSRQKTFGTQAKCIQIYLALSQLFLHLLVAHNGAGYKLRKASHMYKIN